MTISVTTIMIMGANTLRFRTVCWISGVIGASFAYPTAARAAPTINVEKEVHTFFRKEVAALMKPGCGAYFLKNRIY